MKVRISAYSIERLNAIKQTLIVHANNKIRECVVKRDLYAEVSARILTELETGALPWVKPWAATAGQNVPQNAVTNRAYSGCNVILLWLARGRGWPTPRFLTFQQAIEGGGNVRKGEHGTKVYFVKQFQVIARDEEKTDTRLIPMLREYTVFNVAQCENLPDSVKAGKPMRVRNPDARDALADEFLRSTRADIREGGEAYYVPSRDFYLNASIPSIQRRGSLLQRRVSRAKPLDGPSGAPRPGFETPLRVAQLRGRGIGCGAERRVPLRGIWLQWHRPQCQLYRHLD